MKKLALLFVSIYIGTALFYGQGQTAESLLKSKTKSDEEIKDEKKKIKSATWEKRGDLYLEIAQFNTSKLFAKMTKKGITGAETLIGKPKNITGTPDKEDWHYEYIVLHFNGEELESWEEIKPLVPGALDTAVSAYKEADKLDAKGKFKNKANIKTSVATLRGLYTSKGIELYGKGNYSESVKNLEKALELFEWPKNASDTVPTVGLVTYYAGVIAFKGNDYKSAEKFYTKCIENGWEGGAPYSELASVYKASKQLEKEYEILQKGFVKYPGSKELMYGFINYYLGSGQSEKALEKLDQAIKEDPSNPTLLLAKASLFENIVKDSTNKYSAEEKKANFDKAVAGYKKAIEVKADYYDAYFNLGALYYNDAVFKYGEADKIPVSKKAEFEAKVTEAKASLEKSLPFLEKAHEINPKDRSCVETLIIIYQRLQKQDKKNQMQSVLESLPAEKSGL